jgi:hypothetical protein
MPLSVTSAGGFKGSFYGDASFRTAALRKQAIVNGQIQKCGGGLCNVLVNPIVSIKPLMGEHHLQKGSTGGVMEIISLKNPNGFI